MKLAQHRAQWRRFTAASVRFACPLAAQSRRAERLRQNQHRPEKRWVLLGEWPLIGAGLVCRVGLFRSRSCLHRIGSLRKQPRIIVAWRRQRRIPVIQRVVGTGGSLEAEIALQHFKSNRLQCQRNVVTVINGNGPLCRRCETRLRRFERQPFLVDAMAALLAVNTEQISGRGNRLWRFCFFGRRLRNRRHGNSDVAAKERRCRTRNSHDLIDGYMGRHREFHHRRMVLLDHARCFSDGDIARLAGGQARHPQPCDALRRKRAGDVEMQIAEVRLRQMENGCSGPTSGG